MDKKYYILENDELLPVDNNLIAIKIKRSKPVKIISPVYKYILQYLDGDNIINTTEFKKLNDISILLDLPYAHVQDIHRFSTKGINKRCSLYYSELLKKYKIIDKLPV